MGIQPLVNVLTRTSRRPKYFEKCFNSVAKQTYLNINHLISVDDDETENYVRKYTNNYIRVKKYDGNIPELDPKTKIRRAAPYNLYLNELRNKVKNGWIMFLDDDDVFLQDTVIEELIETVKNEDDLLLWKVKFPNTIIPPHHLFEKKIISINNFSMIGFMYNKKYDNVTNFDYFSGGDFFFASKLQSKIPSSIWIDKVYTGIQRKTQMGGFGKKDDLKNI